MWPFMNYHSPGVASPISSIKMAQMKMYPAVVPLVTNTSDKILSVVVKRALPYMKSNGYFSISVQMGFIKDRAGCVEHTTVLAELLKRCQEDK